MLSERKTLDLRAALHTALCDYRLNNMRDEDGDFYPLIDLCSNEGTTVATGREELFNLADYLVVDERVIRALDAARAEGGAGAGLATGSDQPPVQQPRASLSHLVPELTRALRAAYRDLNCLVGARNRRGLPEGHDQAWYDRAERTLNISQAALSQAEQAAGLCVEPSRDGWQPIETAPRDGTPILGCWLLPDRAPLFGVVAWEAPDDDFAGSEEAWVENGASVAGLTHWKPLPQPPQDGAAALSPQPKDNENG